MLQVDLIFYYYYITITIKCPCRNSYNENKNSDLLEEKGGVTSSHYPFSSRSSTFSGDPSSCHSQTSASTPWSLVSRNLELGHYLDQGSFSEVYIARSAFEQGEYAIKRISVGKFIKLIEKTKNIAPRYFENLLR